MFCTTFDYIGNMSLKAKTKKEYCGTMQST